MSTLTNLASLTLYTRDTDFPSENAQCASRGSPALGTVAWVTTRCYVCISYRQSIPVWKFRWSRFGYKKTCIINYPSFIITRDCIATRYFSSDAEFEQNKGCTIH